MNLTHATVTLTDAGCYSTFRDGTSYAAHPHETPHYAVLAHRCGYGDDLLRFCREHEVCHHLVGERLFGGPSPVLWALAHGEEVGPEDAALEELAVHALQRFVRAAERPIVGGIDWDALRARAVEVMG